MRIAGLSLIVAAALGLSLAGEAEYHNCGLCKPMAAEPGLMEHLQWETHEISAGMLSVTTVEPAYEQAYARAHAKMMEAVKRLEAGEKMELCPYCRRINELAQAGAKIENIDSKGGHIMAVTASSAEVIDKIHAHARWANAEFAKHADHGHGG